MAIQHVRAGEREVELQWQTAYAGDEPLARYEVWRDRQKVGQIAHYPQVTKKQFLFKDVPSDKSAHGYRIVSVDIAGRTASAEDLPIPAI